MFFAFANFQDLHLPFSHQSTFAQHEEIFCFCPSQPSPHFIVPIKIVNSRSFASKFFCFLISKSFFSDFREICLTNFLWPMKTKRGRNFHHEMSWLWPHFYSKKISFPWLCMRIGRSFPWRANCFNLWIRHDYHFPFGNLWGRTVVVRVFWFEFC